MTDQQIILKMQREIRSLKIYTLAITALITIVWFSGFKQSGAKQQFTEIDAQRINILEPDGSARFVISNRALAPDLIIKGKHQQRANGKSTPGIYFYNDNQTESGALLTVSEKKDNGNYSATSRLAFDQYESDETMELQYIDENGKRYAGFVVWDRPETPATPEIVEQIHAMWKMPNGPEKNKLMNKLDSMHVFEARRVFVGKTQRKSASIALADRNGNDRISIWVDSLGTPRMEFYDEKGNVTYSVPDAQKK